MTRRSARATRSIRVSAKKNGVRGAKIDPSRSDIAEAFIRRRMLVAESAARRIEDDASGRFERDARIVASVTPLSV